MNERALTITSRITKHSVSLGAELFVVLAAARLVADVGDVVFDAFSGFAGAVEDIEAADVAAGRSAA